MATEWLRMVHDGKWWWVAWPSWDVVVLILFPTVSPSRFSMGLYSVQRTDWARNTISFAVAQQTSLPKVADPCSLEFCWHVPRHPVYYEKLVPNGSILEPTSRIGQISGDHRHPRRTDAPFSFLTMDPRISHNAHHPHQLFFRSVVFYAPLCGSVAATSEVRWPWWWWRWLPMAMPNWLPLIDSFASHHLP